MKIHKMFNCVKIRYFKIEKKYLELFLLINETVQIRRRAQPASPFTGAKEKLKFCDKGCQNTT